MRVSYPENQIQFVMIPLLVVKEYLVLQKLFICLEMYLFSRRKRLQIDRKPNREVVFSLRPQKISVLRVSLPRLG
jgi:hypothetical protein